MSDFLPAVRSAELEDDFFRSAIDGLSGMVYVFDRRGRLARWNAAFRRASGYTDAELAGKHISAFIRREDTALITTIVRHIVRHGEADVEARFMMRDGGLRMFSFTGKALEERGERVFIGMGLDVTDQRALETRLQKLTLYDALTGLPNRAFFLETMDTEIDRAGRAGREAALFLIELDRFRFVNSSLGREFGDRLLTLVAERLRGVTRAADVVARIGGDEFALLVTDVRDRAQAAALAHRLSIVLTEPYELDGRELFLNVHVGMTSIPGDGDDTSTLLRKANIAMVASRKPGRSTVQFYRADMEAGARSRLEMETSLRQGIRRGEFHLEYQPEVILASNEICTMEALLRWHHPLRGAIAPDEFVPIAEETGLIVPLGEWVLREAARAAVAWNAQASMPTRVAVNLSAEQIAWDGIVSCVQRTLAATRLDASLLELEITENVMLEHADEALRTLTALKALGVSIAIDDFGTGYSSLSYLQRFPIDRIKVDRSFVRDLATNQRAAAIIDAIVTVGTRLGMEVVAEGVERPEHVTALRAHGCGVAQGFLFSRPLRVHDVPAFLARHATRQLH